VGSNADLFWDTEVFDTIPTDITLRDLPEPITILKAVKWRR